MKPCNFANQNTIFSPPPNLAESQCQRTPAYVGEIKGGSLDSANIIVVAWQPSEEEIIKIANGQPIFLSVLGCGLPPHYLSTSFEEATHPA